MRLATYYLLNKFGYERKDRNRTIILHNFLIQPGSLKQRDFGGSFQTKQYLNVLRYYLGNQILSYS